MKVKLLISAMALASSATFANEINQQLEKNSFVLKNWNYGKEACLEYGESERVYFKDCFQNKTSDKNQKEKALQQVLVFNENRIYNFNQEYCLRAINAFNIMWSKNCNDETSLFEVVASSSVIQNDKFQLKSQHYNSCLVTYPNNSAFLKECDAMVNEQVFASALKTPMIHLQITNPTEYKRDIILEIKDDTNNVLHYAELDNIDSSALHSIYYPDFVSYLQSNLNTEIKTDFSLYGVLDLTPFELRATDKGEVIVNPNAYNLLFTKHNGEAVKIITGKNDKTQADFILAKDQISLAPYSNRNTDFVMAKGSVIALFTGENYQVDNDYFDNVTFKFASDTWIKNTEYKSVRVLKENSDSTFKITNAKGGLSWIPSTQGMLQKGTLTYGGLFEPNLGQGQSDNYGFYDLNRASLDKWRRGSVFCELMASSAPDCAMLKTDSSAKGQDFSSTMHWQAFPFKQYQAFMHIAKGELFFQRNALGQLELWYAKKEGQLAPLPSNKQENSQWFYMGVYKELLL